MRQGQRLGLRGLREHPGASEFPWVVGAVDIFIQGLQGAGREKAKVRGEDLLLARL